MRKRCYPLMCLGLGCVLFLVGCRSRKPEEMPPEVLPPSLNTSKLELPGRGIPISDFERLAYWQVICDTGSVTLGKNFSQALWGRASAEITFHAETKGAHHIQLIPKDPWLIQSQFDTILLWIKHEGLSGLRQDYQIRLHYRDALGERGDWVMPYTPQQGFQMLHLRVPGFLPAPVIIDSLEWEIPASAGPDQTLYLDSLSIYQEVLNVIPQTVHYVRPYGYAPVYAPQRNNSVTLDFPTTSYAYRPQTRTRKSVQSLKRLDENSYLFQFESEDLQLAYKILPKAGVPQVEILLNGRVYTHVWQGASLTLHADEPELRFARIYKESLLLQYNGGIQYEFSLHGQTLQLEMSSLLENVEVLDLGRISAPEGGGLQTLYVPLMRLEENIRWPVFFVSDGQDPFLISCFPDWWYSFASNYQSKISGSGESGVSLGELIYEPRWRGSRNIFRERIYLSVSKNLQDVLPTPASPEALHLSDLSHFQWSAVKATPSINLMAIDPLDTIWEDRLLARLSTGEWRTHPEHGYLLKSGLFDVIPLQKLNVLRESTQASSLYVPAVAQFPPWRFLDYDVRSVGGATYTQTLSETGALLQQVEAEWGGPLISNGGSEWLWTGLVSGIVPHFPLGILELHPFLPQFAWRNVHPYSQVLGLGALEDFRLPTDEVVGNAVLLDRLLAFQVAYGAMGRIPTVQSRYLKNKAELIQGKLQDHFAGTTVKRIAYWSGSGFVDAGEALMAGVLRHSRLYIRLDNDTEIWVNGDLFAPWSIRVDSREIQLPSFGFVVRGEGLLVMNLPQTPTQAALSLMDSEDGPWVSSPGKKVTELGIEIKGALQVHYMDDGKIQIDIMDWQGEARLAVDVLRLPQVGSIRAVNSKGEAVHDVQFEREGAYWHLQSDDPIYRVWISPEISGREKKFSP
ncbi:hypothetical protein P3T73_14350 [Kiritimatiellota bacterium B12222]|nr:hypothetical protein P3T73_14350 [Kiritimatiellota bacterium B12222]